MAKFLALDFDNEQFLVVSATTKAGGMRFQRALAWEEKQTLTVATAKGIFNRLAGTKPDVIVAELGDGILGEYGVQDILRDPELTGVGAAYVMAAPDPVVILEPRP